MSQNFTEGSLTFSFPDAWSVCRPEDSAFYVHLFMNFAGGCKEMDFLAYDDTSKTLWLIEVKDYSSYPRTKPTDLVEEVAKKTRDVLALLPTAGFNDREASVPGGLRVGDFWRSVGGALRLRVVLHCELLPASSKLFPSVRDAANLQTKLRQKLRAADPTALFTNRSLARALPWTAA